MSKRPKIAALDGDMSAIISSKGHIGYGTTVSSPTFQLEQPYTNGLIGAAFPEKCMVGFRDVNAQSEDPLNWGKVAAGLAGSHLQEVRQMVTDRKSVV